ncbi:MAG: bifunctional UDP-N-acetylglucosamine diphosphorylase/glucosamine-1-phosphate N-acetyltransferase GlmU, partial [Cyanobacteria bacterium J06641_5]
MVAIAVLAAGRGTRMKSSLPKVLHPVGGKPMVERVLESCHLIAPEQEIVIVGYASDRIRSALSARSGVEFAEQTEQLGTGHAVQQVLPLLQGYDGDLLVLNGDVPLLRPETLANLLKTHQDNKNAATLLTAIFANPQGYGRVFCDDRNRVDCIIEDRDCTPEQQQNQRINAGVYCFNWPALAEILPNLSNDNDQQEYYITDVFAQLAPVMAMDVEDIREINGINNREQLAAANDILQERVKKHWLLAGVTMLDPSSITIDEAVEIAPDVTIEPQTHLRGKTVIATGCRIGPGSLIENSILGENVTALYAVVSDSEVAANTHIGPYAHLRGHAKIGQACRIGNFVEIKNSTFGDK